jgi:hypothetical protein
MRFAEKFEATSALEMDKNQRRFLLFGVYYLGYCVVGLFSSQWRWFLAIILLSFIGSYLIKKAPHKRMEIIVVDSIITLYCIFMLEFSKFS